MVGLGIRVIKDAGGGDGWGAGQGRWRVRELIPGFGADLSGQVRVGDVVEAIDKRVLDRVTEEDLVQIMCGPPGSSSLLRLLRPGDSAAGAGGATTAVAVRVTRVDPLTNVLEEEERDTLAVSSEFKFKFAGVT